MAAAKIDEKAVSGITTQTLAIDAWVVVAAIRFNGAIALNLIRLEPSQVSVRPHTYEMSFNQQDCRENS